jgi:hypothetical protein
LVTAPTCTEKGYTSYTCTVCKTIYKGDETEATGHNCGSDGVCVNCGETISVILAEGEIREVFSHSAETEGLVVRGVDTGKYGEIVGQCPLCGKNVVRGARGYGCMGYADGCEFRMGLSLCNREIPIVEVKRMFREGRTAKIPGFISRAGKLFSARLKIEGGKVGFDFT